MSKLPKIKEAIEKSEGISSRLSSSPSRNDSDKSERCIACEIDDIIENLRNYVWEEA
jgi:hypothetical protein